MHLVLRPPTPCLFLSSCYGDHRALHSFPTRRSSDLGRCAAQSTRTRRCRPAPDPSSARASGFGPSWCPTVQTAPLGLDRKSTRLNSSHLGISYAVFCLKKKTKYHYHL